MNTRRIVFVLMALVMGSCRVKEGADSEALAGAEGDAVPAAPSLEEEVARLAGTDSLLDIDDGRALVAELQAMADSSTDEDAAAAALLRMGLLKGRLFPGVEDLAGVTVPEDYTYFETAGVYYYNGRDLRVLEERYPESPLAAEAVWARVLEGTPSHCEADVSCMLWVRAGDLLDFIRAYPRSRHVPDAVTRVNEGVLGALSFVPDLRLSDSGGYVHDPEGTIRLIMTFDSLARAMDPSVASSAFLTIGTLWERFAALDLAREAYGRVVGRGAVADSAARRLAVLPERWTALAPARAVSDRLVVLDWAPVPDATSWEVRRVGKTWEEWGGMAPAGAIAMEGAPVVATLPGNAVTWWDTLPVPDSQSWYRVSAATSGGPVQSNPSLAWVPEGDSPWIQGAAFDGEKGELLVFGVLPSGFPRVLRIPADDGTPPAWEDATQWGIQRQVRYRFEEYTSALYVVDAVEARVLRVGRDATEDSGSWPPDSIPLEGPLGATFGSPLSLDRLAPTGWAHRSCHELSGCWWRDFGRLGHRTAEGDSVRIEIPADVLFPDLVRADAEGAWLIKGNTLARTDLAGNVTGRATLPERGSAGLALDVDHRWLWMTTAYPRHDLLRVGFDGVVHTVVDLGALDVDWSASLAVDPRSGGVWVVDSQEARAFSTDGALLRAVSLSPGG